MHVHRNEIEKLRQKNMLLCSEASVEKSSLPGDSGGPMFNFNQEKKHILLGTISISSVKKPDDLSTIYRNCFGSINLTQKWIEENLN